MYWKLGNSASLRVCQDLRRIDPPPLKWSALIVRKRRIKVWESSASVERPAIALWDARNPEEIVTKLRQVEVLCGQGMPRVDAIRQVQITEQIFYRWRK